MLLDTCHRDAKFRDHVVREIFHGQNVCTSHVQLSANERSSFDLSEGAVWACDIMRWGLYTKYGYATHK